jgi:hypothetical protein
VQFSNFPQTQKASVKALEHKKSTNLMEMQTFVKNYLLKAQKRKMAKPLLTHDEDKRNIGNEMV